jgi:hypothetical protein
VQQDKLTGEPLPMAGYKRFSAKGMRMLGGRKTAGPAKAFESQTTQIAGRDRNFREMRLSSAARNLS